MSRAGQLAGAQPEKVENGLGTHWGALGSQEGQGAPVLRFQDQGVLSRFQHRHPVALGYGRLGCV